MHLIREDGRPVEALLRLARRHGIEADDQITAQTLSEKVQERWIRKTEHQYQIPGGVPVANDMALLKELKLVDAVSAPPGQYAGGLLLGATVVAVRKRLAHLLEHHRNGTTVNKVFMLGGARPLDKEKEKPEILGTAAAELPFKPAWTLPPQPPTTEAGMMRLVFEQSDLPAEWHGVFIDTPLQPAAEEGKTRHPNTADTAREFLKTNPEPGTYLAVSSQPFVARQTLNVRQALPESFTVVGIGYAAPATTPLKTFLDEVARLLYEEVELVKAQPTAQPPPPSPSPAPKARRSPSPKNAKEKESEDKFERLQQQQEALAGTVRGLQEQLQTNREYIDRAMESLAAHATPAALPEPASAAAPSESTPPGRPEAPKAEAPSAAPPAVAVPARSTSGSERPESDVPVSVPPEASAIPAWFQVLGLLGVSGVLIWISYVGASYLLAR